MMVQSNTGRCENVDRRKSKEQRDSSGSSEVELRLNEAK